MPTKICSSSRICLAAQTTISSWGVYSIIHLLLIPIIDGGGVAMLFDAQTLQALLAEFLYVVCTSRYVQYPFLEPGLKAFQGARALVILVVVWVVTVRVALYGGRVRSPWLVDDGPYLERWSKHTVR